MFIKHSPASLAGIAYTKSDIVPLPGAPALAGPSARALTLAAWLGIFSLLFVAVGVTSYLPCASFAELGLLVLFAFAARGGWRKTPLDSLIGAFAVVNTLAMVWGYAGGYGARSPYAPGSYAGGPFGPLQLMIDQLAAFAAYYLAAWTFMDRDRAKEDTALLRSLVLSAAVVLFLCLLEWSVGLLRQTEDPRIEATFGNPNLLASYLLLAVPALMGMAFVRSARRGARVGLALLSLGLLFALWLTQSRGAWIGAALGAAFAAVVLFAARADQATRRRRARGAIAVFAGCCAGAALFGAMVAPRLALTWHEHSMEERQIIWQAAASIVRDHPLTGVGLGGFPAAMVEQHLMQLNDFTPTGRPLVPAIHLHAHNLLLQMTVERGVAGLLLGVWLIIAIAGRCLALFSEGAAKDPLLPAYAGLAAGLIGVLVQCVADDTLWYAPVLILLWLILGLLFAQTRNFAGNSSGAPAK